MKLGILDVAGSIEQALELAPLAERLGYTRYWIAEHQPQPSPILIAAIVAGQTTTIRVGTAGVLLHYVPPLRTAHDFRFLDRVFHDRFDAGFCAGITPDPKLLEPDRDGRDLPAIIEAYSERAARLVGCLRAADPSIAWAGGRSTPPAIWSLGHFRAGDIAARHGLSFGYSLLHRGTVDDPAVVQRYRDAFVPHPDLERPTCIVAVWVACAATASAAREHARSLEGSYFVPRIVGDPTECAIAVRALAERFAVDEIVIADMFPDLDHRIACYELLAAAIAA